MRCIHTVLAVQYRSYFQSCFSTSRSDAAVYSLALSVAFLRCPKFQFIAFPSLIFSVPNHLVGDFLRHCRDFFCCILSVVRDRKRRTEAMSTFTLGRRLTQRSVGLRVLLTLNTVACTAAIVLYCSRLYAAMNSRAQVSLVVHVIASRVGCAFSTRKSSSGLLLK